MSRLRRNPIRSTGDGTFRVRLGDDERRVLGVLPAQMREVLANPDDPGLVRLFPPAYSAEVDRERQDEFRRLMADDLAERHRDALATLEATATAESVTAEQLDGWMRAVNSVRLLLGTRLDVSEDDDLESEAAASPEYALYLFLGYLQECIIEALTGETG